MKFGNKVENVSDAESLGVVIPSVMLVSSEVNMT